MELQIVRPMRRVPNGSEKQFHPVHLLQKCIPSHLRQIEGSVIVSLCLGEVYLRKLSQMPHVFNQTEISGVLLRRIEYFLCEMLQRLFKQLILRAVHEGGSRGLGAMRPKTLLKVDPYLMRQLLQGEEDQITHIKIELQLPPVPLSRKTQDLPQRHGIAQIFRLVPVLLRAGIRGTDWIQVGHQGADVHFADEGEGTLGSIRSQLI